MGKTGFFYYKIYWLRNNEELRLKNNIYERQMDVRRKDVKLSNITEKT